MVAAKSPGRERRSRELTVPHPDSGGREGALEALPVGGKKCPEVLRI